MQNIPSHEKSIRMLFKAAVKEHQVEESDNKFTVPYTDEVLLVNNIWKYCKDIVVGDILDGNLQVKSIQQENNNYIIEVA